MKINDILKPGLQFTTPGGKTAQVIGVEKDKATAPVWRNRVEYYGWIVFCKIEDKLVDIKFDTNDNFKGVKYHHEGIEKYRMKL